MNPIDESIAIKLFGWRWLKLEEVSCRAKCLFPPDENAPIWFANNPPSFHDNETLCFRVLIPAMEKRGYVFGMAFGAEIRAQFDRNEYPGYYVYECRGETVAEAICQAALRALEEEANQ